MRNTFICLLLLFTVLASPACSKRQLGPTLLAGGGTALMVSGVAYRASFHDEEDAGMLGRTAEQKGVTATLLFTGLALIVAGVIWSATTPVCETDDDCWIGDVCEPATRTCVPEPHTNQVPEDDPATAGHPGAAAPPATIALPEFEPERFTLQVGLPTAPASRWQLAVR